MIRLRKGVNRNALQPPIAASFKRQHPALSAYPGVLETQAACCTHQTRPQAVALHPSPVRWGLAPSVLNGSRAEIRGDTSCCPSWQGPLPCHVIWPAQHSVCQHSTAPATRSPVITVSHSHSYVGLGHCDRHSLQARAAQQARGATATRVCFWRVGIHSTAAPLPGSRHIINIFSNLLLQPGLAYCVPYTLKGCKLVP